MLKKFMKRAIEIPLEAMWDVATITVVVLFTLSMLSWVVRGVLGAFQ